jgi:hypothetical protein
MRALVCVLRTLFFEGEKKIRDLLLEAKQKEKKVQFTHPHKRGGGARFFFDYIISILHNDKF